LAEAAIRHARALPRLLREQMEVFAGTIEITAAAWPGPLMTYFKVLESVARQADIEVASVMWPSLMRLRGMSL
jgi:hypothetical protein